MIIRLTTPGAKAVWVNMDQVQFFDESGGCAGSTLFFHDRQPVHVCEMPRDIVAAMEYPAIAAALEIAESCLANQGTKTALTGDELTFNDGVQSVISKLSSDWARR